MNKHSNLKIQTNEFDLVSKVIAYENAEFVERLKVKIDLDHEAAEQLFFDMKQFLYMCGTRPGICSPTDPIDDAWHEFLAYTHDYKDFCMDMFGRFIHHVPPTYLSNEKRTKGKTWRTYQVALDIFGELSQNWDVPEHMRPQRGAKPDNVELLEFDNCGDSCGCGPACNGD